MADYYPLLARAIAGLSDDDPEIRSGIYERARHALLLQLQSSDPPLSDSEIARERLALEEAIRRLEEGLLAGAAAPGQPLPPQPAPEPTMAPAMPEPEPVPPPPAEPARPRVMPRPARPRRSRLGWIVFAALVPVTIGMGFLAYSLNRGERASDATQNREAEAVAPPPANSKVTERLNGEPEPVPQVSAPAAPAAPAQSGAPAAAPSAATPAGQPAAAAPKGPAIAVAQRAVLLLQDSKDPQQVVNRQGSIAWRLDSESPGAGQPLDTVVKATFDFNDEKLHGDIVVRRNNDAALPASHTIEVIFRPDPGSPNGNVKAVSLMEARENEQTRGVILGGSQFPVSENYFLIGLTNVEPIRSRNLQLLRDRDWLFFELEFSNGRRGAILLERSDVGRRVFNEALDAWQQ